MSSVSLRELFEMALRGGPEWDALVADGHRREAERFEAWVASGRCTLSTSEIERVRATHHGDSGPSLLHEHACDCARCRADIDRPGDDQD